ncbi:hypothetical protein LguiA_001733 [Lonicera macranthoides]
MGKKVKKKARGGQKEKRVATASPQTVPQQSIETQKGVSVAKERKICPHLDKGIDLAKLSLKLKSSEPVKCEDCREGAIDKRASKGKGKHGKKKGGGSADLKSDSKAIWVCLECGHFSCGGAGFPTTPQSHAVRHARQTRHPLAVKFENPNLRWCFPCSSPIPLEYLEENSEQKDVLPDIVKMIKARPSEVASLDVEDTWFGSGSVISEVKSESTIISTNEGGGYVVRGLVNLGNTCFFNSIMQNLLAMDKVRDYFLNLDRSVGPLTVSLKKLYIETIPDSGLRNVINPKPFFGCVCTKAPQFRGYQQHDSHELLRCLLDALCTEELSERKQFKSCEENGISSNLGPTFVDAIFGGQISSTVCCLKCGHSSIVYEPFLDLSLPVPTKRPPPKKTQPVSKAKKPKLPPKRSGRVRSKVSRDAANQSTETQNNANVAEKLTSSADSVLLESMDGENKQSVENVPVETTASLETSTWLDYLDFGPMSNDDMSSQIDDNSLTSGPVRSPTEETAHISNNLTQVDNDTASPINHVLVNQDSLSKEGKNDNSLTHNMESGTQDCSTEPKLINDNSAKSLEDEHPLQVQDSEIINDNSANSLEDERPLQVQDSEIIFLPYKEDIPSTSEILTGEAPVEESTLDFDGLGDLFNEPDEAVVAGPAMRPTEAAETGFTVGNSSGSDPDEVDNSDSPVSVESCLAYFTKPELLSKNEHAWHCESCSKSLRIARTRMRKKLQKSTSNTSINEIDDGISNTCSTTDQSLVNNGNIDQIPVLSQVEEGKSEMNDALPELSESLSRSKTSGQENFGSEASELCSFNEPITDKDQQGESEYLAGENDSEGSEDEAVDSESVKVKRDATKRILINNAPPILTVHLKRFSQDTRGRLSKLNGHVDFKEIIDLRPYMDPRCTEKDKYRYRLVGVVEHLGSMRGGHYVAYVKGGLRRKKDDERENGSESMWYHASDVYVREASLEEVLKCEAYILFYEEI